MEAWSRRSMAKKIHTAAGDGEPRGYLMGDGVELCLQADGIHLARIAGRERMHAHFRLARQREEQSVGVGRSGRRHLAVGTIGRRAVVHSPQLAEAADEEDRRELLDDAGLSAVPIGKHRQCGGHTTRTYHGD